MLAYSATSVPSVSSVLHYTATSEATVGLAATEIKALMKSKGWTFVDLAARWGVSVTWMSRLVNQPHSRPPMYDDAFRGLPQREATQVVREARHVRKRKPRERAWTPEEMFPLGRLFEAIDNKIVEEGTRLISQGLCRRDGAVFIKYLVNDGDAAGDEFELKMNEAQAHFQDLGLDA